MCRYVRQALAQPPLGRGAERLLRAVHHQGGGPHGRRQCRRLGLFSASHLTMPPSCRLAHRPPEAQPATGVAHLVVQRPGYYLADERRVHFVLQPNQESSVLGMSRAFDDYYIEDRGVILTTQEVTQRRTDNNDQFVILATVGVAFVLTCL
ncbi:hypothetical protein ZEAMMB73_Zm00001d025151 [Zea mays]|uniref:protein-serine/threonine phosphatase n=1 Tax=Zea mays TaxID=4577 RepID=A0A1D6J580_MAIZE|nr:hypothetical protein ZEAMMB73_Zm00001d025151 [Zea mays]